MFKNSMCKNIFFGLMLSLGAVAHAESSSVPHANAVPDSQIAKIVMTIDDSEIDAGKLARKHAQSQEVKDFAQMMVDRHETNMKATKEFAKKNKIKPEDNDTAKALKEEAKLAEKDLKRQDKTAFDRAYMKNQISMHEKALATLKDSLIPSAQNSDFKAHLEKVASHVAEHLAHAKTIETKLQ